MAGFVPRSDPFVSISNTKDIEDYFYGDLQPDSIAEALALGVFKVGTYPVTQFLGQNFAKDDILRSRGSPSAVQHPVERSVEQKRRDRFKTKIMPKARAYVKPSQRKSRTNGGVRKKVVFKVRPLKPGQKFTRGFRKGMPVVQRMRQRRAQQRNPMLGRAPVTIMPPTAIGRQTLDGPVYSLTPKSANGNHRVRFRTFYDNVAIHYATTSGIADIRFYTEDLKNSYTGAVVAPQWIDYTVEQILNLVKSYNKYKMFGMALEYEPRVGTNTSGYLTIASDPDIEYAETHGMIDTKTGDFKAPMPLGKLKGVNNARTTPVWGACPFRVSVDKRIKFATNSWQTTLPIDFTTLVAADARQSTAGAFFIGGVANTNAGLAGTDSIIGDMYQIWDVMFMDFSTSQTAGTEPAFKMEKLASQLERLGFTRESKTVSPTPSKSSWRSVEIESFSPGQPPNREVFNLPSGRKSSSLK